MESFNNINTIYNSLEVIEIYEKLTGLEYLIPEAFYYYYSIEVFKIPKKSGSIKKITITKIYENYQKLQEDEKQIYTNYEEKLAKIYSRKVYRIGNDFLKSFGFIRITDEICKVIKKNLKKDVCMKCWLRQYMCICNKIKKVNLSHRIYLIFHYSEILKASNTGKLLKLMDDNTEILIFGIEEYENKIREIFSDENFVKNSVCLFPSKDSILASDFYNKINEEKLNTVLNNNEDNKNIDYDGNEKKNLDSIEKNIKNMTVKGLNFFVIDGTWPQAISMMQIVPKNMIKVKILAAAKNIYNSLRYMRLKKSSAVRSVS